MTILGTLPLVLIVGPGPAVPTLAEYLAAARARPGQMNFGSGGNGTLHHLTGELVNAAADVDITHVPYRGAQAATADVLGGRIEGMWDSLPSAAPHIRSGAVRALAVSSAGRSARLPGDPDPDGAGRRRRHDQLVRPGGPRPRCRRRSCRRCTRSCAARSASAAVKARFATIGVEPVGEPPDATQRYVLAEIDRWSEVVRATGVTMD